jgi:hypothetical protein
MTLILGLDIGNATTEAVLIDPNNPDVVVAHDQARTRGAKGSPSSLRGAADLIRRLERAGHCIDSVAVSTLRPVKTSAMQVEGEAPPAGPIQLVARGASTPANPGFGFGRVHILDNDASGDDRLPTGDVVLVVPRTIRFDRAAERINKIYAGGALVRGLLVEANEAVLLANRLDFTAPVVDEVDIDTARTWQRAATEVSDQGQTLIELTDPLRIASMFGLAADQPAVTSVATRTGDATSAVVIENEPASSNDEPTQAHPTAAASTGMATFSGDAERGWTVRMPDGSTQLVDDLYSVNVHTLVREQHCGNLGVRPGTHALAYLDATKPIDPSEGLKSLINLPVHALGSETAAARVGALTTPGSTPDGIVIDLGAGTIDVISPAGTRVLAGSGHLVTAVIATALEVPQSLAEWIKRGPAVRIEGPFVAMAETGERKFLDHAAPADQVGRLVTNGPAGPIPFSAGLQGAQWRSLRLAAKAACLGGGIARAADLLTQAGTVVVVGGPAIDAEVLTAVRHNLPDGLLVGRGDVAGSLGPRYAVAYGLARTHALS